MIGILVQSEKSKIDATKSYLQDKGVDLEFKESLIMWASIGNAAESVSKVSTDESGNNFEIVCAVSGTIFGDLAIDSPDLNPSLVIANRYLEYGTECIDKIDGEYFVILYDERNKVVYLKTDNAGLHRYYYKLDSASFVACSNLEFIVRTGGPLRIKDESLLNYFQFGYVSAPNTIYETVFKTLPNTYSKLDVHTLDLHCQKGSIFSKAEPSQISQDTSVEKIEQLLIDKLVCSIDKRLNLRKSASVLLSSGYDSSLIAALLTKQCDQVYSYTIGFKERETNENFDARNIAEHLGTIHEDIFLSSDEMLDTIEEWVVSHAQPWAHPNGLSTYLALNRINKSNQNSPIFDGVGGDSLFRDFRFISTWFYTAAILSTAPKVLKKLSVMLERKLRDGNFREILGRINDNMAYGRFGRITFFNFWKGDYSKLLNGIEFDFEKSKPGIQFNLGGDDITSKYLAYMRHWAYDATLGRALTEGSLHNLQATFPFEDRNLVDFAERLPNDINYKGGGRYFQAKIAHKYIPEKYFAKRKKAMETPLELVLKSKRGIDLLNYYLDRRRSNSESYYDERYVKSILADFEFGSKQHAGKLWNILIFEIWAKNYL